ncbi:MAG: DNA cytosine methyltransferase [Hymenobacter sp.]|nr:MAG: DNA cytosine methyltransferase [Hymenobacter sp.]
MNQQVKSIEPVNLPILSFFTGGGFLDMGFEQAGFSIKWTNEIHLGFADFYKHGMTAWRRHINPQAQEAVISSAMPLSELGGPDSIMNTVFPTGKPKLFGMIGGPPCQDFSIAGLRAGFEGSRGSLTHEYCRHVLEMRPAFFVMENVTGLMQKNHRATFYKLCESLGGKYLLDHKKVNALDYGVRQSRERLFLIGIRRDLVRKDLSEDQQQLVPMENWAGWTAEQHETHHKHRKTCQWAKVEEKDAMPKAPACETIRALCVDQCLVPLGQEELTPNAWDHFVLNSEKAKQTPEGMVSSRCFKRLHRYRFSPTACYGNNEVHLHPWLPRRLSVREVLRIQGVDDSYVLPPGPPLTTKFKMIGNGVPVPMAEGIARTMRRVLEQYCGLRLNTEAKGNN